MTARISVVAVPLLALGCSGSPAPEAMVERVSVGKLVLEVQGEGSLQATRTTQIFVPGSTQWSQARLDWLAPDGSSVRAGDPVARFSADKSREELIEAQLQIQRTVLERESAQIKNKTDAAKNFRDLDKTRSELSIASIYAGAEGGALARNKLLDAMQDRRYLDKSLSVLNWRIGQEPALAQSDRDVVDARMRTFETMAADRLSDLQALEIRAPHDGLFLVERNWAGDKVSIGTTLPSGNVFGDLPDVESLQVEVVVPQINGEYLHPGLQAHFHPVGHPEQRAIARVAWVSTGAHVRSNDSPMKYFVLRAPVPRDISRRYRWAPGQSMAVTVTLLASDRAIGIPNIALRTRGKQSTVRVIAGGRETEREVVVGQRGVDRSQILQGLAEGEEVVIGSGDGN